MDLGGSLIACHKCDAVGIDQTLQDGVGEGNTALLDNSGDREAAHFPQKTTAESGGVLRKIQLGAGHTGQHRYRYHCGHILGDCGGPCGTGNAHMERAHGDQIQHYVETGGNHQKIEGTLGISKTGEDCGSSVIDKIADDAKGIDGKICAWTARRLGCGAAVEWAVPAKCPLRPAERPAAAGIQ